MRRLAAAGLALAVLAAGCGSDEDAETTEQPAAPPTSSAEATTGDATTAVAATQLAISVWELGRDGGPAAQHTLTCSPPGGDLPDPEAACAAIAAGSVQFEPVPADAICTEIYGGPAEATVTGTVDGKAVEAEFSRTNGCEVSRWESAAALLPADLNAWQEAETATTG